MKNPIWENIIIKKKSVLSDTMRVLSSVPIFSDLDGKELIEVEKIVHRRKYKKGEPIFRMGDPGLGMYIIVEGAVEIIEELEDEDCKHLVDLEKGAFFGDLALLDEAPRSASAIAKVDCDIIGFFRPDLLDLLYRKPHLGIKILWSLAKVIGERLRKTNEQLSNLQREMKVCDE
ncbi:MAG: cyclic nucleotide-binding domain-containing protein [Candidatus Marinimicrobia bacterium]|jgi:CRP-like cAMP-binding protein|nr:cyclic nucleotide-binding domain-containing protein [Candidatus Neomarinimicrobiota bacterium]MCK9482754.1 cyclic nucleotide-binding domain-containing protein [Candidatus Neomarinimicrobiota bacterium]MCK9558926.1 cyclic nucleotide-binding domain-containing protein [Candidatus Neomarinimicrobiota bacterium]